ncbi:MAG: ribonuclease P protein component [Bacteroidia bacterium]|nr:ribonuclease P protein component [Bacteroidia bacterium]
MVEGQRFTFKKEERVSGKKRIENLFAHGQSFLAYPFRIVFYEYECAVSEPVSILISIPKKRLKRATARNRMKRLVREAYRLNKNLLQSDLLIENHRIDLAFVYVKDELSGYDIVEKSVCKSLREISNKLKIEREKC